MVRATQNRSAKSRDAKVVIYTRIRPKTVKALDAIRESMPYTPTRAQIIDAALAEYVERHQPVSAKLKHHDMMEAAKKSPPPQAWFEEDTKELRRPAR